MEQVLGEEVARTLMESLPPFDWDQLATKPDLEELRREMRQEFANVRQETRREFSNLRKEFGGLRNQWEAMLHRELQSQMKTLVTLMFFGWTSSLAAIAGIAFALNFN